MLLVEINIKQYKQQGISEIFVDIMPTHHDIVPEKRMCASTVRSTYKLTPDDLDDIPHVCVRNPHYRCAPEMRLYTQQDIEAYIAVHYHPENVTRREQARREAKNAAMVQKKECEEYKRREVSILVERVHQKYARGLAIRASCREENDRSQDSDLLRLSDDVLGHIAQAMVASSGSDTIYSYDMAARDMLALKQLAKSPSLWRMSCMGLHMLHAHMSQECVKMSPIPPSYPNIKEYFIHPFLVRHPFYYDHLWRLLPRFIESVFECISCPLLKTLLRGDARQITTKEMRDFSKAHDIERYSTRTKEQLMIACLDKILWSMPASVSAIVRLGASTCCYDEAPVELCIGIAHIMSNSPCPRVIRWIQERVMHGEIEGPPAHETSCMSTSEWRTFIYRRFGEDLRSRDLLNIIERWENRHGAVCKKAIDRYKQLQWIYDRNGCGALPGMSKKNGAVPCQLRASDACTGKRHGRCPLGFCEHCCEIAYTCAQESQLFMQDTLYRLYNHT